MLDNGAIPKAQLATGEHKFTQQDLRKMFYYGDTKEKVLISLAVSLGYGAQDFLALECKDMRALVERAKDTKEEFVSFISVRKKTGAQAHSFLTPEAVESLSTYLQLLEKQFGKLPKYLWCNSHVEGHITTDTLNNQLRALFNKANIKATGTVRFHLIRKYTFSVLHSIHRDIAKLIVGKQVSASILTYIQDVDGECERVFREGYKRLCLNTDITGTIRKRQQEQIDRLEEAITKLAQDSQAYKTTAEVLTKKINEVEGTVSTLINLYTKTLEGLDRPELIKKLIKSAKEIQQKQDNNSNP